MRLEGAREDIPTSGWYRHSVYSVKSLKRQARDAAVLQASGKVSLLVAGDGGGARMST